MNGSSHPSSADLCWILIVNTLTFTSNIADDSLVIKTQRSIIISATSNHIDQCQRDEQFAIKTLLS